MGENKKDDKPQVRVLTRSLASFKALTITGLAFLVCLSGAAFTLALMEHLKGDTPITVTIGSDGNSASFVEGTIVDVAARVTPGVVSIVTETRTTSWFGQTGTASSAGTGMIVTADGYVLTNKHVIDGAHTISVILDDGTTYDGVTLVGTDPLNDVAFLKIENAKDLPTVTLGNSKTLSAGQQVIAIGNALGQYQNTITSGIISGTGRSLTAYSSDYSSSESLTDMIQTDAAINAGNSGGPLVNAAGEVIGINTATSTEAEGIGFAIPISAIKGMLRNITENGKAERSYIGVYGINITPDVAKAYELPVSAGTYLVARSGSAIMSGSPAEKAGLKDEDIIIKVNGTAIGKAGSLTTLIGEYAPGDTVQLLVRRGGDERAINVTLEAYKKR